MQCTPFCTCRQECAYRQNCTCRQNSRAMSTVASTIKTMLGKANAVHTHGPGARSWAQQRIASRADKGTAKTCSSAPATKHRSGELDALQARGAKQPHVPGYHWMLPRLPWTICIICSVKWKKAQAQPVMNCAVLGGLFPPLSARDGSGASITSLTGQSKCPRNFPQGSHTHNRRHPCAGGSAPQTMECKTVTDKDCLQAYAEICAKPALDPGYTCHHWGTWMSVFIEAKGMLP